MLTTQMSNIIIIGGSVSVPIANIFMRFVAQDFPYSKTPPLVPLYRLCGNHYIGCLLVFFKNLMLKQFEIYFTVYLDSNISSKLVSFLDVTVNVYLPFLSTRIFRKPTDTQHYLLYT